MFRKILVTVLALCLFVVPPIAAANSSHGDHAVSQPLKVAMLVPGNIKDGGFMEAGYQGLVKLEKEMAVKTAYIDGVKPELEALSNALRTLAQDNPNLIIAHGGQCSQAAKVVAAEFPHIQFTVVQGNVSGDNLSSYEILQEESAWLAGAAAGLMTKTGVVGHISGIRVVPGLKGRAAFADGVRYTNPGAKILTTFAGNQDDNALSKKVAQAQINAGADIIFTMLNSGRTGAIEACKENNVYQIGNVKDWTKVQPDVFVASAIANVSIAAFEAGKDMVQGTWQPGQIKKIGLSNREAVSLALAPYVPQAVAKQIEQLANQIAKGEIHVAITYEGPEFSVE